jgi:addiction module HigA family antidote
MLNPVHPGPFIKSEIVAAHNLSVTAAAAILGVSRPTLSTFLNGKSDLSGDMAVGIDKAFGVDMETLMRMQNGYDIARTRKRRQPDQGQPFSASERAAVKVCSLPEPPLAKQAKYDRRGDCDELA